MIRGSGVLELLPLLWGSEGGVSFARKALNAGVSVSSSERASLTTSFLTTTDSLFAGGVSLSDPDIPANDQQLITNNYENGGMSSQRDELKSTMQDLSCACVINRMLRPPTSWSRP